MKVILVIVHVCMCVYVCCTLERVLLHFAFFNPFSVCDEMKYV